MLRMDAKIPPDGSSQPTDEGVISWQMLDCEIHVGCKSVSGGQLNDDDHRLTLAAQSDINNAHACRRACWRESFCSRWACPALPSHFSPFFPLIFASVYAICLRHFARGQEPRGKIVENGEYCTYFLKVCSCLTA